MADELKIPSISITYADGTGESKTKRTITLPRLTIDVTGTNMVDNVQAVGTAQEVVALNEAGVGGYMFVHNLDPTNYVEIRPNIDVADLIKLKAGQWAIFPTATDAVPYAIANTSACNVRFVIIPA